MNNGIDDMDDDDIPLDAFTSDTPRREAPERKPAAGNGPTGPACPDKCKDEQGRTVHTWRNTTRNGKPYFRCSRCKGAWWPQRDDKAKLDPTTKWPPLDK
jgi:hypothetical protein